MYIFTLALEGLCFFEKYGVYIFWVVWEGLERLGTYQKKTTWNVTTKNVLNYEKKQTVFRNVLPKSLFWLYLLQCHELTV